MDAFDLGGASGVTDRDGIFTRHGFLFFSIIAFVDARLN
jgi:hypothetical protein